MLCPLKFSCPFVAGLRGGFRNGENLGVGQLWVQTVTVLTGCVKNSLELSELYILLLEKRGYNFFNTRLTRIK